jgi:hypothetical protein
MGLQRELHFCPRGELDFTRPDFTQLANWIAPG